MAVMSQIKDGLEILIRYGDGHFSAINETIFAGGPKPEEMRKEDRERLESLRWFWNPKLDCWERIV